MLHINQLRQISAAVRPFLQGLYGTFLCFVSVIFLNGCMTVNTVETRNLDAPAQPFQRALFQQYTELALREVEEGNINSAEMFDFKARLAAAGNDVPLPVIHGTHVLSEKSVDLRAGQQTLQKYFEQKAYVRMPIVSARAQAMFDCWLEEQTQGVDEGDIAACKQAFVRAIAILDVEFPMLKQSVK